MSGRHTAGALAALLFVGACSDDGSSADKSSSSAASATSAPVGANAQITLEGDPALTAAFAKPDVRCGFPDVDGTSIALLSTPEGLVFRIRVQDGKVTVLVSDADNHERDFSGTGVTGFDAAMGAEIDSPLAEATAATAATGGPGEIGTLTAIKGSVDCAGQSPGTSTITLNGIPLEDPRVECNVEGAEVIVVGIADTGAGRAFVDIGLRLEGVDLRLTEGSTVSSYLGPAGSATLTTTGATVAGDALAQGGTPPGTVHVEGDVVCGTAVG
jgi:hypothetical protein